MTLTNPKSPSWLIAPVWLLILLGRSAAEPIELTCTPDDPNESWTARIVFDTEARTLTWADSKWDLLGATDQYLVARTLNGGWPTSLLIDRETGDFWRTVVGDLCADADCATSQLGGAMSTGFCLASF